MRLNYMQLSDHQLHETIYREAYDDVSSVLGKNWWIKKTNQKERALRNLLINLQVCGDEDSPFKEVSVYKRREAYSNNKIYKACHFKFDIYVPLIEALTKTGWCTQLIGFQDARTGKSFTTRLLPNEKKVIPIEFKDSYIEAPFSIELRDEEKNIIYPYPQTRYATRAQDDLDNYNQYLIAELVLYNKYNPTEDNVIRIHNLLDTQLPKSDVEEPDRSSTSTTDPVVADQQEILSTAPHYWNGIYATSCNKRISSAYFTSRRIYNDGTWKHGGRHYNSIQNYSQAERKQLSMNGKSVVELDYKAMHPTMLYHMLNKNPPADCYAVFGDHRDGIARECIKHLFLTLVNAESEKEALAAVQLKYNRRSNSLKNPELQSILQECRVEKLADIAAQIKKAHQVIAQYFSKPHIGKVLQKKDSEIMRDILKKCMKQGIPAIPVHDSVIVPADQESNVIEIMQVAYFKAMGGEIVIEAK